MCRLMGQRILLLFIFYLIFLPMILRKLKPIEVCNFIKTRTNGLRLNAHYKCVNGPTDGGIFPDPYGAIEGFATSDNYCSYSWQRFSAINGGEQYIRHALDNNTWSEWSTIAKT